MRISAWRSILSHADEQLYPLVNEFIPWSLVTKVPLPHFEDEFAVCRKEKLASGRTKILHNARIFEKKHHGKSGRKCEWGCADCACTGAIAAVSSIWLLHRHFRNACGNSFGQYQYVSL